jgi:hypothetical protein
MTAEDLGEAKKIEDRYNSVKELHKQKVNQVEKLEEELSYLENNLHFLSTEINQVSKQIEFLQAKKSQTDTEISKQIQQLQRAKSVIANLSKVYKRRRGIPIATPCVIDKEARLYEMRNSNDSSLQALSRFVELYPNLRDQVEKILNEASIKLPSRPSSAASHTLDSVPPTPFHNNSPRTHNIGNRTPELGSRGSINSSSGARPVSISFPSQQQDFSSSSSSHIGRTSINYYNNNNMIQSPSSSRGNSRPGSTKTSAQNSPNHSRPTSAQRLPRIPSASLTPPLSPNNLYKSSSTNVKLPPASPPTSKPSSRGNSRPTSGRFPFFLFSTNISNSFLPHLQQEKFQLQ